MLGTTSMIPTWSCLTSTCSEFSAEKDYKTVRACIIVTVAHNAYISSVLPTLFSDINRCAEPWGAAGTMNPFKDIYNLVFQMTVRMTTCDELATDARSVQIVSDLYWKLEKSSTPVSLLLPWFPGTAKKNKNQATKDLYDMLSHYVDLRRNAVPNSNAIDVLITDGEDNPAVIGVGVILQCTSPNSDVYGRL
jgi:hypothetical protein